MARFSWPLVVVAVMTLRSTPVASQTAPASSPQLAVSGVMFGQYAYALRSLPAGGHANNFDVTRAYLTFTGKFADGVGSRVTADIYRNADGSLAYRLKYGFASWNPKGSALTYKLGMIQTPFVEFNEQLWDYRVQGSDPTDRAGYLSSSDFGLGVDGSWGGDKVTLNAGVYNGEFYSKAPGDQHKDVAARVSVRLLASDETSRLGGLRLTGFTLVGQPNGGGTRERYLGQMSYRSKKFWLAAELMGTRDRTDTGTAVLPTVSGRLISAYGVVKVGPKSKIGLLGRFDAHDRNTATANDALSRIIAGVSYQVNANLRGVANVDHTWYQGGSPTPALDAARSQLLMQVQINF